MWGDRGWGLRGIRTDMFSNKDTGSVVVESLCLESESRLESPVSESESSPSH